MPLQCATGKHHWKTSFKCTLRIALNKFDLSPLSPLLEYMSSLSSPASSLSHLTRSTGELVSCVCVCSTLFVSAVRLFLLSSLQMAKKARRMQHAVNVRRINTRTHAHRAHLKKSLLLPFIRKHPT